MLGHLKTSVALLGVAWATDFADGRLARSADVVTRLRRWDLRTDAWLGACVTVGLVAGGFTPAWVLLLPGLAALGFVWAANPALLALTTGAMFGLVVWELTAHGGHLWWVPGALVAVALLGDRHRFFRVILPAMWEAVRYPFSKRGIVLDDWTEGKP